MKKIIALILVISAVAALSACALIRRVDEDPNARTETEAPVDSETYATDFSDTVDSDEPAAPVRYSEDQAYDVLYHSFPDYDMELVKIKRTRTIVAENDGTEYYIYSVSLPKKVETEASKEGEDTKESESTEVEMEPPVPYYVSVNGVVHKELADGNVDTKYAVASFTKKYGEKDKDTGFAYKLKYEGLLKSGGNLCYSFAVYKVNDSGAEAKNQYSFNYLVTVDGKQSAQTKIEH